MCLVQEVQRYGGSRIWTSGASEIQRQCAVRDESPYLRLGEDDDIALECEPRTLRNASPASGSVGARTAIQSFFAST